MKKIVVAFPRQRYSSASNGGPQLFLLAENLMAALTYATSGSDARVLVTFIWGIDYPLVMGGNLTMCVVKGRSTDCADTDATSCFQFDPPPGFTDCLTTVMLEEA